jgi:hypothetical protein
MITALLQLVASSTAYACLCLEQKTRPGPGQKFSFPHTRTSTATPPNSLARLRFTLRALEGSNANGTLTSTRRRPRPPAAPLSDAEGARVRLVRSHAAVRLATHGSWEEVEGTARRATPAPKSHQNSNLLRSLSITLILGHMHGAVNVCKKNN